MSRNNLFLLGAVLLVGLAVWQLPSVVSYLSVSGVLVMVLRPVHLALCRIKVKRFEMSSGLAALMVVFALLAGLWMAAWLVVPPLINEAKKLAQIDPVVAMRWLDGPMATVQMQLDGLGLGDTVNVSAELRSRLTGLLNLGQVTAGIGAILGFTGNMLAALFSILFITFFLLKDGPALERGILARFATEQQAMFSHTLAHSLAVLRRYVVGLMTEVGAVALLTSVGMAVLGVPQALLIGLVAGLFNVIPYLGPLLGIVAGLAIAFSGGAASLGVAHSLVLMGAVFVVVQLIDNLMLQPIIYSRSVKAHPLEVFLVILAAGNLAGVAGMVLAVPTYSLLRIVAAQLWVEFGGTKQANDTE